MNYLATSRATARRSYGQRLLVVVVLASSLLAPAICCAQAAVPFKRADELAAFSIIVGRGAVSAAATANFAGGDAWVTTGGVDELPGGAVDDDDLLISGSAYHEKAPHAEPPNAAAIFAFPYAYNPGDLGFDRVDKVTIAGPARFEHAGGMGSSLLHYDHFVATLAVRVDAGLFSNDILGYDLIIKGVHTASSTHSFDGAVSSLDPNSAAVGSVALIYDDSANLAYLTVAASNIGPVMSSGVFREALDGSDELLLDLGSSGSWLALDDNAGFYRDVNGVSLSGLGAVESLLAGETFLVIHTDNDELQGAITLVPEPAGIWLGLAGLTIAMRRARRRWLSCKR